MQSFSTCARAGLVLLAAAAGLAHGPARAQQAKEVSFGQQFGAVYLPMMVMEHLKLVEKHLPQQGLPDTTVRWTRVSGPAVLTDGILSGNIHFSAQGAPSTAVLWDRTRGTIAVKAIGAIASNNIWLNTKNPAVKSLRDFTDKDRIAIPSLKVSTQAIMLHIAVEKEWGAGQHTRLDHITVALAHPDAMAAVLNPTGEITAHFATSPFHEAELKAGLRTVISVYDIMGGPTTGINFVTTDKFRTENPKAFAAASAAFDEAIAWINADKRRAAKLYLEITKDKKMSEDEMTTAISGNDLIYTKVPANVGKMLDFMHRTGAIKTKAQSWKDLYFAEAHGLPGS